MRWMHASNTPRWRELTEEERAPIRLAHAIGLEVQYWSYGFNKWGRKVLPEFDDASRYRIKPEDE